MVFLSIFDILCTNSCRILGDAPLEVIIGDGAGFDDNLGNDNENADGGRDSAKRGPGSDGLSGIDGGDDTGLRKGKQECR